MASPNGGAPAQGPWHSYPSRLGGRKEDSVYLYTSSGLSVNTRVQKEVDSIDGKRFDFPDIYDHSGSDKAAGRRVGKIFRASNRGLGLFALFALKHDLNQWCV